MAETLTLTVPVAAGPALTQYTVGALVINLGYSLMTDGAVQQNVDAAVIQVLLIGDSGRGRYVTIASGAAAITLARQLNTANLTNNSLNKQLLTRAAAADAAVAGAVGGAPD